MCSASNVYNIIHASTPHLTGVAMHVLGKPLVGHGDIVHAGHQFGGKAVKGGQVLVLLRNVSVEHLRQAAQLRTKIDKINNSYNQKLSIHVHGDG